jgi:hypothetical protein
LTYAAAAFAALGAVAVVWGATAIGNDDFLPTSGTLASSVNFWGWIAIVWGGMLWLASSLVLSGSPSAKFVGVTLASTATIFWCIALPKFPVVAVCVIVVNSLIIYGLIEYADSSGR